jgi:hypothetical protein
MSQVTHGYKVITRQLRQSAWVINPAATIQYPVGKWAKPRISESKLFAFNSLLGVEKWTQSMKCRAIMGHIVVPCLLLNAAYLEHYMWSSAHLSGYSCEDFQTFWKNPEAWSVHYSQESLYDSVVADAIKCLE